MSRVLVIELPDAGDQAERGNDFPHAMRAVSETLGFRGMSGARVFGAVAGDAAKVLSVFEATSTTTSDSVSFDEFARWATEHGINVNECVRIAFTVDTVRATAVTDEPVRMEVTEYLTDDFSHRFIEDGVPAVATRVVPLRRLPSPPGT